ncbi:MAG: hypothetical protein KME02_12720 [Aphanothece saxicola GSE-SYN-MK-01-06B]|nr:hypothetical protein [Aphanothece saxicola GSE-SYN-MK-01-06B]
MLKPTIATLVYTLCVSGFASMSLPAYALGAKCPASSSGATITPLFLNSVLRCNRRTQATPICPPTHPIYRIMPEQTGQSATDFCAPANVMVPAPSQRANVMCPSSMNLVVNGGSGNSDICRSGSTTQVAPLLIPN